MDKLPLHTTYHLLKGAREEKKARLEKLRNEWGENPTKHQVKELAKLEAKIAEYDSVIPQIEAFMSSNNIHQGVNNV